MMIIMRARAPEGTKARRIRSSIRAQAPCTYAASNLHCNCNCILDSGRFILILILHHHHSPVVYILDCKVHHNRAARSVHLCLRSKVLAPSASRPPPPLAVVVVVCFRSHPHPMLSASARSESASIVFGGDRRRVSAHGRSKCTWCE